MTAALREAGAPIPPLKYRIWHWLKDHPEHTAKEITAALMLTYEPGQAILDLERAGVIKAYSDITKRINPVSKQPWKIKRYSVTNHREYVQAPRKHQVPKSKPPTLVSIPAHTPVPTPAADDFSPESLVSKLTLMQVKSLYVYLHGVFK